MKILGDRVIIELDKTEEKSASGMVKSVSKDQTDFSKGRVVLVGEGKRNDDGITLSPKVQVDDRVIFQYGTLIQLEGKSYLLVLESDIIAIY